MYFSVSQAGSLLGVCSATIRRWDRSGKIKCSRTLGNHRRIHSDEIKRIIAGKKHVYRKRARKVASYSRVSSHEQKAKGDLKRQQERLRTHCNSDLIEISDVASGLNTKRRGLKKLMNLVRKGKISEVFITYKDRLTRFGFEYLENYFSSFGVKITVLDARQTPSVEQEMVDDMIALITSFSGKIHGMRSRKRKKRGQSKNMQLLV